MIVAPRFEGDTDTALMMVQHRCYQELAERWAKSAGARCFAAEALLGVRTEMGQLLRDLNGNYDHRNLQDAHDLIAAAFRCRGDDATPQRTLSLFGDAERQRMAWLDFANNEIEQVLCSPQLSRSILQSLAYSGSAVGIEARARLVSGLRERYDDVPFFEESEVDLSPRSGSAESEDPNRALFLAALSCLDPVPYAAWYRGMRAREAQTDGAARLTEDQIRDEWEALLAVPELRAHFDEVKEVINDNLQQRPILLAGSVFTLSVSRFSNLDPEAISPEEFERVIAFATIDEPLLARYNDVKRVAYARVDTVVYVRRTALPGGVPGSGDDPRSLPADLRRSDDGNWLLYRRPSLNSAVQHLISLCTQKEANQRNANFHAALVEQRSGHFLKTPLERIRSLFERGEWTAPTRTPVSPPVQAG